MTIKRLLIITFVFACLFALLRLSAGEMMVVVNVYTAFATALIIYISPERMKATNAIMMFSLLTIIVFATGILFVSATKAKINIW